MLELIILQLGAAYTVGVLLLPMPLTENILSENILDKRKTILHNILCYRK